MLKLKGGGVTLIVIDFLSLYFIPIIIFFFRHGYPFLFFLAIPSLFFGSYFLACLLFLWATIVYHIFYFRDVTEREFVIIWSIYLVDGGNANSWCRNFESGCGRVRDQESMRRFSLGSQNLTKLNEVTSSICIRFFMKYDTWIW